MSLSIWITWAYAYIVVGYYLTYWFSKEKSGGHLITGILNNCYFALKWVFWPLVLISCLIVEEVFTRIDRDKLESAYWSIRERGDDIFTLLIAIFFIIPLHLLLSLLLLLIWPVRKIFGDAKRKKETK